ncbi:hypothetical protein Tco_1302198 [Tanacetum coccineum]
MILRILFSIVYPNVSRDLSASMVSEASNSLGEGSGFRPFIGPFPLDLDFSLIVFFLAMLWSSSLLDLLNLLLATWLELLYQNRHRLLHVIPRTVVLRKDCTFVGLSLDTAALGQRLTHLKVSPPPLKATRVSPPLPRESTVTLVAPSSKLPFDMLDDEMMYAATESMWFPLSQDVVVTTPMGTEDVTVAASPSGV